MYSCNNVCKCPPSLGSWESVIRGVVQKHDCTAFKENPSILGGQRFLSGAINCNDEFQLISLNPSPSHLATAMSRLPAHSSKTTPINLDDKTKKEDELGTLIIVLLKARNLPDKHSFRKSDVFAQATMNGNLSSPSIKIEESMSD